MKIRYRAFTLVFASLILTAGLATQNQAFAQAPQAYKVKSMLGGNFDKESRENLHYLVLLAREHGTVPVWVVTKAIIDPNLEPESPGYAEQKLMQASYRDRILEHLGIGLEEVETVESGPFFAIDATDRQLRQLARMKDVRGFWGLTNAGSVSGK